MISASGYVSASTLQSGIEPPWPSVVIGRPNASSIAVFIASKRGPVERADERVADGDAFDRRSCMPHGHARLQVRDERVLRVLRRSCPAAAAG